MMKIKADKAKIYVCHDDVMKKLSSVDDKILKSLGFTDCISKPSDFIIDGIQCQNVSLPPLHPNSECKDQNTSDSNFSDYSSADEEIKVYPDTKVSPLKCSLMAKRQNYAGRTVSGPGYNLSGNYLDIIDEQSKCNVLKRDTTCSLVKSKTITIQELIVEDYEELNFEEYADRN